MDIRLDVQSGELWGEEEIVGCEEEIRQKLRETFKILGDARGANLGSHIENMEPTVEDVKLWQETYRIEKMLHILAGQDRRHNKEIKFQFDPVVW